MRINSIEYFYRHILRHSYAACYLPNVYVSYGTTEPVETKPLF